MGKFRKTSNFMNRKAETCDILKCLLVYIGFNLKCIYFSGLYVKNLQN